MFKLRLFTLCYTLLFTLFLCNADLPGFMPPNPHFPPEILEDMKKEDALTMRDCNYTVNPIRDAGKSGMQNSLSNVVMQTLVTGTKKMPCILIKFPDQNNINTTTDFQDMLFTVGGISTGSVRDYYQEVSYGKMTIDGIVNGWYTTNNPKSGYAGTTAKCAYEAAQKADAAGFNWAPYDNDGDGYVDSLWVIHSGLGAEESGDKNNDIWSHSWDFYSAGLGVYTTATDWPGHAGQKIKIKKYIIMPERSKSAGGNGTIESIVGIGVFCHEFGHALGLPDLYDVGGTGEGLGNASLMAGGSWGGNGGDTRYPAHLDAWSKIDLGWLTPDVISTNGNKTLNYVESNNSCYLLKPLGSTNNQYFLVENRQHTGFDSTLFATGIFIYHIDEDIISSYRSTNKVNNNTHAYGVALEEADATTDSYSSMHLFSSNGGRGSIGDSWPNGVKNTFSASSIPSTKTNAGITQNCGITNIPAKSNAMTAFYYIQPALAPLTGVVLTASPANTILYSQPVTLTAVATGGLNLSYKFMFGAIILRDFASSNSFSWTPLAIKTYNEITVIAKDTDGSTVTSVPISITTKVSLTPLSAVALTVSPANTILYGKSVTLTATATGGQSLQYKFMYGAIILRDFASNNSVVWTPLAIKTYSNITVIAKDIDATTVTSLPISITTKPVLSAITITSSPANSLLLGNPVTLSATATGGVNLQYKFMYGAVILRDFAASNSISWTPLALKAYSNITVVVKDIGVDPVVSMTSSAINITTKSALTAVALSSLPLTTCLVNTLVTLTATATGGGTIQYKFMTGNTIIRDFSNSNTCTWTPVAAQEYPLTVLAKDLQAVNPNTTVTSSIKTFVVTASANPLSAVSLSASPTTVLFGTTVTLTATATGGVSVMYKFMYGALTLHDFAASNSYTFTPSAVKTYSAITVIARDNANTITSLPISFVVANIPVP